MILGIDATNIVTGGGLTHCREILSDNEFKRHGFSKVILWSSKNTIDQIKNKSIHKKTHYLLNKKFFIRILWNLFFFKREIKKEKCDALLVLGGYSVVNFNPTITICQNMLPFEPNELKNYGLSLRRLKFFIIKILQINSFLKSKSIIFLSHYAREKIDQHINLNNKKTAVIPHGINEIFNLPKKKVFTSSKEQSKKNSYRFIYVSSVDMYKHQWNVVKAIGILKNKGYNVKLDLIGEYYKPALRKMNNEIDIYDKNRKFIHYHGKVNYEKLPRFYSKADIIIFASSCENLPIILLEGMATSLPIICSNLGPMREIMGDHDYYFNPYNYSELLETIKKMILSFEVSNGKNNLIKNRSLSFTWENCRKETFNFISKSINN